MPPYDFYSLTDKVRERCDEMTPSQVEDFIGLLRHDLNDRKANRDTREAQTDAYRRVCGELFRRAEATYRGHVIKRLGDTPDRISYLVGCKQCAGVVEAMAAVDSAIYLAEIEALAASDS